MNKDQQTHWVKQLARELGFDFCGVAESDYLEDQAPKLEQWLKRGSHGQMRYMERNFDKRLDPRKLVPGSKSVVTLLYNHYPSQELPHKNSYKLAKYAYGKDYHFVIKSKLKEFLNRIREQLGAVEGRVFVDSAPVLERVWAQRSGLGWIGKNSLLLNRGMGSFFFIAELILDLELTADPPIADYCGDCTRCIDSCPTEAITPYQVDASKCISYFTIELKDEIPPEHQGRFEDWIFGCDICQDVCPWNNFARAHQEADFKPLDDLFLMNKDHWEKLSEEEFQRLFKHSALKRSGYKGLKRNIAYVKQPKTNPGE